MQYHKMNKKALFLPLFVFATIFILGILYSTMHSQAVNRDDLVGINAVSLMKLYDESEKTMIYFDLAAEYSSENTGRVLAENGGYSDKTKLKCESTSSDLIEQESYIIWNSCPVLEPNAEFNEQFKQEFNKYIQAYVSSYSTTDYKKIYDIDIYQRFGLVPEIVAPEIGDVYNHIYTTNTRKTNILNLEKENEKLVITLADIFLQVENAPNSFLTIKPKLNIKIQDLKIYDDLMVLVQNNCINKPFAQCETSLKQAFPDVSLTNSNNLIKIKLLHNNNNIKFAINPNGPINLAKTNTLI